MKVILHLHNKDAPKCTSCSCSREILILTRYHCHQTPKANRGASNHRLQPIAVEAEKENKGGGTNGITEEERRERQRMLQLHIHLIEHASRCKSTSCTSSNCAKMKSYMVHGKTCKLKASGGCLICKRVWTLLRIHAQKCKDAVCPVPQCMAIHYRKKKIRFS